MYVFGGRHVYNNLYYLFSEYLYDMDPNYLMFGYYTNIAMIYYVVIKDLNLFSERKTNSGLFNIKTKLIVSIYIKGHNGLVNKMLPKNMKFIENIYDNY